MTDALAAHQRLMEQLRDRITTHALEPIGKPHGFKRNPHERVELQKALEACFERGMTRKQAAIQCGCTNGTIVRMFGKDKKGRGRRRKCK